MDVSSCGAHYNISLSGDLSVPHWAEAGQCGLGWLMTDRQWKCQDLRPLQSWSSRPASNQLISDDKQSARESHNNMKVTGRVFPSEEEGISKQQQADTLLLSSKVSTGETGEGFIYIYWKTANSHFSNSIQFCYQLWQGGKGILIFIRFSLFDIPMDHVGRTVQYIDFIKFKSSQWDRGWR